MNLDFNEIKVLVIGDFMIDYYFMGQSKRMSPEAPVPVVIKNEEYFRPGGAGNVAINLSSMGANVTCAGIVGNDKWGKELLNELKINKINTDNIEIIDNHITTLKKRIYSNGKQLARIDKEAYLEWSIKNNFNYESYDAVVISDYNKGVINKININANLIIVDPKKEDFSLYKNAKIITPNLKELELASKNKIQNNESIIDSCNKLIQKNNFDYIVAKKGSDGMTIVGKDNFFKHIPAHFVEDPDVTGAGDTVIAVLSIAYAKTNDIEISAKIANMAAAISVSKPGTANVTVSDLMKYDEKSKLFI